MFSQWVTHPGLVAWSAGHRAPLVASRLPGEAGDTRVAGLALPPPPPVSVRTDQNKIKGVLTMDMFRQSGMFVLSPPVHDSGNCNRFQYVVLMM